MLFFNQFYSYALIQLQNNLFRDNLQTIVLTRVLTMDFRQFKLWIFGRFNFFLGFQKRIFVKRLFDSYK